MNEKVTMPVQPNWDVTQIDYRAIVNDWHAVCLSSEVEEDKILPIQLMGEDLIVWRHDGAIHAWKDYCRHRGAKLSLGWIKGDRLVCPYHGWEYDGQGQCELYPAHPSRTPGRRSRAYTHNAEERYGYIWVCIGEPKGDIPAFPNWLDSDYRKVNAGPYVYKANALRAIENFLDVAHFPFVHAGLNGDPNAPDELENYNVDVTPEGLTTSEIKVFQPYGDHRGIPITAKYTFSCSSPTTAYFEKQTGDVERFCTLMMATPVDQNSCIVRLIVAINFGEELTTEQILKRQNLVFNQDRRMVETQRPHPLPVDVRDEIHLSSDKLGVEYRRWVQRRAKDHDSSNLTDALSVDT